MFFWYNSFVCPAVAPEMPLQPQACDSSAYMLKGFDELYERIVRGDEEIIAEQFSEKLFDRESATSIPKQLSDQIEKL